MSGCERFERRLDDLLGGTLAPPECAALERHAAACASCRELLELARSTGPEPPDLTAEILARTSGPACLTARERLGDYVDDALSPLDAELLRLHLEGCRACGQLRAAVAALSGDLPLLAERPTDARFVHEVLARTSGRRRPDLRARLVAGWRGLLTRPRFALEAAYAMTALVVLIVGIPNAPVAGVSRRAFEITNHDLRPGIERSVQQAGSAVSVGAWKAWETTGDRLGEEAASSVDGVNRFSAALAIEIRQGVGTLWTRLASEQTTDNETRSPETDDRDEGEQP